MMIQTIWLVLGGEKEKMYALLRLIDAVRSKAKWGKLYSAAVQSEMEWSSMLQSALLLWDLSIQRGGGEGAGSESFHVHRFAC